MDNNYLEEVISLLRSQHIAHRTEHMFHALNVNKPISKFVEPFKRLLYFGFTVWFVHRILHALDELIKADFSLSLIVILFDEVLNVTIVDKRAYRSHRQRQIMCAYETIFSFVKKLKDFLALVDLPI